VELISTIAPPRPASTIDGAATFHRVPGTGQVHVEHVGEGLVLVRAAHERGDPGVGDDAPHRAECRHPLFDGGLQGAAVADVDLLRHDPPALRLDQAGGLGEVLGSGERIADRGDVGADVDGDDVGAVGRQADRVRAALTAGRAGGEGDAAVEGEGHGVSSAQTRRTRPPVRRPAAAGAPRG